MFPPETGVLFLDGLERKRKSNNAAMRFQRERIKGDSVLESAIVAAAPEKSALRQTKVGKISRMSTEDTRSVVRRGRVSEVPAVR